MKQIPSLKSPTTPPLLNVSKHYHVPKMKKMVFVGFLVMVVLLGCNIMVDGENNELSFKQISNINKEGSYLGIVVPNPYELSPLFQSSTFVPHNKFPYFDFAGRHFRIGELEKKKVIVVMCGESMLNAGVATQLLLTLFDVRGVLHYGIAGNLNSKHQIGDVAIPKYWAHTGEWHWQRFGDKEDGNGKFNTEFGYLKFSDYKNYTKHSESSVENLLNKVWYQPERIFPVNGTPEKWQDVFWVPVDKTYFEIARKRKNFELIRCVKTTCLPKKPVVVRVKKGVSGNVFVDNRAYREHLKSKFDATPTDMESAAVALVCFQQNVPFIAFRGLSDLAGGGSGLKSEIFTHLTLAAQNAFDVLVKFISLL
ncbi:unnamed protein product [Trifolium pratense]|uniref:Uncharacterized protein n=1 Tax=Trifolium pratense TaxID=57577 RepID=A0ACB0IW18_TRIPR|nr:unnamed protein product [Trifolium pratense]